MTDRNMTVVQTGKAAPVLIKTVRAMTAITYDGEWVTFSDDRGNIAVEMTVATFEEMGLPMEITMTLELGNVVPGD